MKRLLMAAAVVLAMTACAGTQFTIDDARKVYVGMPEAELVETMGGAPTAVKAANGKIIYTWSTINGLTGGMRVVSFYLKDSKVSEVPHIPASMK